MSKSKIKIPSGEQPEYRYDAIRYDDVTLVYRAGSLPLLTAFYREAKTSHGITRQPTLHRQGAGYSVMQLRRNSRLAVRTPHHLPWLLRMSRITAWVPVVVQVEENGCDGLVKSVIGTKLG